ncbi:MFS transporter, PHS family, inorganic phosphate transporter [Galdieria sulphuraria]|uniref:MFS transporter, PHS family, inorganic phosphate transporter n=1 Tax=Galdieria sulphuraria TaxID=130081 RepID=M2Y3A0_GALSU|nr:MFS transporter, PHS family, inorganic phosphate transporter [Galdieria sulphuraria]EME30294.1 MFS transporter, PHS family, inorganic phosphate transporter [Galdieria sulphuraria]|eukprot:XP_005706814.1 MFS transporter, PHS family, inorganic phosphate transporter [Galdieria sulphuraria]
METSTTSQETDIPDSNRIAPLSEEDKDAIRFNAFGTSAGFFVNGYMYNINSVLLTMFTDIFPSVGQDVVVQTAVGVSMLYGVMFGLLVFGVIADHFGRKKGLIMCSCLVLLGNLLGVAMNGTSHVGTIWMMCIAQGVAGLGMGGEYTCNIPNTMEDSEQVNPVTRGRRVAMLSLCLERTGNFAPLLVQLLLVGVACRNAYLGTASNCNWNVVARLSFGIVTIPVIIVLIFRTRMKDSVMFKKDQLRRGRRYDGLDLFVILRHFMPKTIGVVTLYFLVDWINYSQGTFGNLILQHVIGVSLFKSIWLVLVEGVAWIIWTAFIAAFIVDKLGRRKTGMFGWLWLGSTQLINTGFFYQFKAKPIAWIIWSTFVAGFQNFVYICAYLVPAEAFPTRIRATMYGISVSLGVMGAIVGTTTFPSIWLRWSGGIEQTNSGLRKTMWFYAGMEFLGLFLCMLFVPEYSHRSLAGEDTRFVELRRRHCARFATKWGVTQQDLECEDLRNYTLKGLVQKLLFNANFLDYRRLYMASLCRSEKILLKTQMEYIANLPIDYKDLTLFSSLWSKYKMGKIGYQQFVKNSEEMGYYDIVKEMEMFYSEKKKDDNGLILDEHVLLPDHLDDSENNK